MLSDWHHSTEVYIIIYIYEQFIEYIVKYTTKYDFYDLNKREAHYINSRESF